MICCKCHKEITKTYGRVTDLGNYCKECAKQNEVEAVKLFESNMKSVLEIEKKNAVREFAERIKAKAFDKNAFDNFIGATYVVLVRDIDKALEEYINGKETH